MKSDQLAKLTQDLRAARPLIEKACHRLEDGGSCNFDAVTLWFETTPRPAARTRISDAVQEAGFQCDWIKRFNSLDLLIYPGVAGMAYRRTKGAETLHEHLRATGWNAVMYYQLD